MLLRVDAAAIRGQRRHFAQRAMAMLFRCSMLSAGSCPAGSAHRILISAALSLAIECIHDYYFPAYAAASPAYQTSSAFIDVALLCLLTHGDRGGTTNDEYFVSSSTPRCRAAAFPWSVAILPSFALGCLPSPSTCCFRSRAAICVYKSGAQQCACARQI